MFPRLLYQPDFRLSAKSRKPSGIYYIIYMLCVYLSHLLMSASSDVPVADVYHELPVY